VLRKIPFIADAGDVARSVAVSVVAIALAVYAMVMQERRLGMVVLAAIVLVIAAGGMLQVSRAVRQLRRQQAQTRQAALRAERHYFKVMRRIVAAVEAREPYTHGRSRRVGNLARRMGERLGLGPHQCRLLELAGQVHDIGMLAVPDCILNKPSRLGTEEFRTVKRHAEVSFRILEPLTFLAEMLLAVRYHHERMNGTGYPYGLQQQDIPLSARILAVADSYDAMTHDRPYAPALGALETLDELRRCTPAGYDGQVVAALEEVVHAGSLREAHGVVAAGK
jgi:HD-GYP domain-containing protein (c-di-GMP phosphodiesterase class II)